VRQLNEMFHIEGERLVKTSNGEAIPDDEPVFILRGRDCLASWTIRRYIDACEGSGVPEDRLEALRKVKMKFSHYAIEHSTKTPGSTHGK
jgi:hypothetical protein